MPSTNIILATLFDGNLKVKSTNVDASIPDLVSDISGLQDDNLLKIDLQYPPVSLGTGDTASASNASDRFFTRSAFPDLWDWMIAQGAVVWGSMWSSASPLTFEYNGATETYTGLKWYLFTNYGVAPYEDHIKSYENGGLNGFLPQGGATNVTVTVEATAPSSASGESCPKIVFQDAPMSGQIITVKTY